MATDVQVVLELHGILLVQAVGNTVQPSPLYGMPIVKGSSKLAVSSYDLDAFQ